MFHGVKNEVINHGGGSGVGKSFHVGHTIVDVFSREESILVAVKVFEELFNDDFGSFKAVNAFGFGS